MKLETYEVTVLVPSTLTLWVGIAVIYLLGVWIYDRKTYLYNGWIFRSGPRWWAWAWPLVFICWLYVLAYVTISDFFNDR